VTAHSTRFGLNLVFQTSLAQTVEESIRATGVAEVPSDEVGLVILDPLRDLDEVAFLRFASVYQAFTSVDDFEKAIVDLRTQHRHSL